MKSEFAFNLATVVGTIALAWVLGNGFMQGLSLFSDTGDPAGMIWPVAVGWIVFWLLASEWFRNRGE